MCSSRDENQRSRAAYLQGFSSFCAPAFPGAGFLQPAIFPADKPAAAIFDGGRKPASGRISSKVCWRNSKQRTRSIGIVPWWIAPRYVPLAEAQKPAQIPRIDANWEASTICSPMPMASPWPLSLPRPTATMLLSCFLCSTRSRASKASEGHRAVGPIRFKEIALMILNLIVRRSKKGDKAPLGKAPNRSRQRLGHDTLVCRTNVVLAAPVSQAENARGEISVDP
jgi:hypothetical protein